MKGRCTAHQCLTYVDRGRRPKNRSTPFFGRGRHVPAPVGRGVRSKARAPPQEPVLFSGIPLAVLNGFLSGRFSVELLVEVTTCMLAVVSFFSLYS